jgi:AraC-like DNA-binding protein
MEHSITAKILQLVESYVTAQGGDYAGLLKKSGLSSKDFANSDGYVPLIPVLHLFELSAIELKDELFGLHLGETLPNGSLGLQFFIIATAATLRDAMKACARYVSLTVEAGDVTFTETKTGGHYTWHFKKTLQPRKQYSEFAVAVAVKRISAILGRPFVALAVNLESGEPDNLSETHRILGRNITFNSPAASIFIRHDDLNARSATADPYLYRELEKIAEMRLPHPTGTRSMVESISSAILKGLPLGHVSQAEICSVLAMTPRTLQRTLEEHGETYRGLLDKLRRQLAHQMLTESSLPLTEIAFVLGYSELSVFSRSAKQWFGTTPSKLRLAARAEKGSQAS